MTYRLQIPEEKDINHMTPKRENVREEPRKNILKVQRKIVQNLRREFGVTDIN